MTNIKLVDTPAAKPLTASLASGAVPILFRVQATNLTGNVDIVSTVKCHVVEVWAIASAAGGAGDTITVQKGASAITNALDLNVSDAVVVRAGTIDDGQYEIAVGDTLRVAGASAVNAEVFILAHIQA